MFDTVNPAWFWLVAGLILCAAEALAPGAFLLWLGLAALATGLVVAKLLLDTAWAFIAFGGFAVLFGLIGRLVYGSRGRSVGIPFLNRRADALIGREFVLPVAIDNGFGHIRVEDSIWRVAGPDLPAGSRVRVTGVEKGVLLRVEPA